MAGKFDVHWKMAGKRLESSEYRICTSKQPARSSGGVEVLEHLNKKASKEEHLVGGWSR